MKTSQLSSISEYVQNNLLSGEKASNTVIIELISELSYYIKAGLSHKIPPEFYRLSGYVKNKVQFGNLNEISADMLLVYGKLWSIATLVEVVEQEESMVQSIDDDVIQFENKYVIFKAIRDKSGITHDDLAKAAGVSVSSLSQFISKLDYGKYFVSSQIGRRKYYYITDNGRELIDKIEIRSSVTNIADFRSNYVKNPEGVKAAASEFKTLKIGANERREGIS